MTSERVILILKAYKKQLEESVSNQLGADIEAFEFAIKAIETNDEMQKWVKPCYNCKFRPDRTYNDFNCADCYHYDNYDQIKEG